MEHTVAADTHVDVVLRVNGSARRVFDPETGRIVNATFGDYLIPANADVPDIDVVFVGTPDTVRPLGIKGIGEIGVVGLSAAIANAVYHATGRRIRSLPITVEQLL
jgi:CO/xanthine dehydrogenase Mo-binding subunit